MELSGQILIIVIMLTIFITWFFILNTTAQFQVEIVNQPASIDSDPTCWLDNDLDGTFLPTESTDHVAYCHVVVTDNNSYQNISDVWAAFYHSTSSFGILDDKDVHYSDTMCVSLNDGSGADQTYNCSFGNIRYYADSGTWTFEIRAWDGAQTNNASRTKSQTIFALKALNSQTALDFGSLAPETSVTGKAYEINNTGNAQIRVTVMGSDLTCGRGSISAANVKYALTDVAYASMCGDLSTSDEWDCDPLVIEDGEDNLGSNVHRNTTYWGIQIPTGVSGSCSGNPSWNVN